MEKISIHKRYFEKRVEGIKNWKVSSQDKKDIKLFLRELSIGKVNKGFKVSENRQSKYLDLLKVPMEFFKKPVKSLTIKDIEKFEIALSSDKIQSRFKKKPFSPESKSDIKKALRIYLRWKLGDKSIKMTNWLDVRVPKKTVDYISESDVNKLYRNCSEPYIRFAIAVLFDSGARAEEFHNIRFEDIQLPDKDNFVKITLKDEYSKTAGRTIGLYWKNSLEAVKDYLDERKKEGYHNKDQVFDKKYDNMRQVLIRLGKKVLNRSLHYHLFRHSSATHYASKLNRQELCYRYGWKFSSDMPDTYISRAGMIEKQVDDKFTSTELGELKSQMSKQEMDNKILSERLAEMNDMFKKFAKGEVVYSIEDDQFYSKKLTKLPMKLK